MTCTGQRRACTSVAFSDDCTQLAACSKDGSWSVWRIDVRYEYKEDPRLRGQPTSTYLHFAILPREA